MQGINYRCDKPMAEKKGVLKCCNQKCDECPCAIKNDGGSESHVVLERPCSTLALKNLNIMSGRRVL